MATVKTFIGNIKGNDGTSVTISNISESSVSGGSNIVTFSDGKTLTVKNGKDGGGNGGTTTGEHFHSMYLYSVGDYIASGADLASGSQTLTVASEVEETSYVKVSETLVSNALIGRWVLIEGKRAYVGSNTTNQLALYTNATKTNPMNYSCPAGTVIYPADTCIDIATEEDLTELDKKMDFCTGVKIANGIVYPYMSPNLAGEVFSLRTNGATEETSYINFRGATAPMATNALVGRWVLIDGKRAYVGANSATSLSLYTDETKTNPCNFSCASGTVIYPADVMVADLAYVKKSIPSTANVIVVACNGFDGERGRASHTSTEIQTYVSAGNLVLAMYQGKCFSYRGWSDTTQTVEFVFTEVGYQGEITTYNVSVYNDGEFTVGSIIHS